MTCLFCEIIKKNIPAAICYEDEDVIAFDDIHPKAPIHKLIVPKKHIATLNDVAEIDAFLIGKLQQVAKHLAIENAIADAGYRLIVNCNPDGGQEIYHLHLHLLGGRIMGAF